MSACCAPPPPPHSFAPYLVPRFPGPLPAPHDTKHDAADATWPRILPSSVHPERLGAHLASSHGTLGEAGVDLGELLAGLDCITSGEREPGMCTEQGQGEGQTVCQQ